MESTKALPTESETIDSSPSIEDNEPNRVLDQPAQPNLSFSNSSGSRVESNLTSIEPTDNASASINTNVNLGNSAATAPLEEDLSLESANNNFSDDIESESPPSSILDLHNDSVTTVEENLSDIGAVFSFLSIESGSTPSSILDLLFQHNTPLENASDVSLATDINQLDVSFGRVIGGMQQLALNDSNGNGLIAGQKSRGNAEIKQAQSEMMQLRRSDTHFKINVDFGPIRLRLRLLFGSTVADILCNPVILDMSQKLGTGDVTIFDHQGRLLLPDQPIRENSTLYVL